MLRHAARARRVPAKGRMGTPHTPFFAREACRRRNPPQTSSRQDNRNSTSIWSFPRRQASRAPLSASQPSDAHAAQVCFALGSARPHRKRSARRSVEAHLHAVRSSDRATPRESRLFTQRPKTAYVFILTPRLAVRPAPQYGQPSGTASRLDSPLDRCGSFAECASRSTLIRRAGQPGFSAADPCLHAAVPLPA